MSGYSAQDVAKMLGLTAARLRSYVRAGLLAPERGEHGELRFSFQDLLVVRTAEGLVKERIPPRRVRHALQRLRARLPDARPLSGLQLHADGEDVVVRDGNSRWNAASGQVLLDLGAPGAAPRGGDKGEGPESALSPFPVPPRTTTAPTPPPANDIVVSDVVSRVSVQELYEIGVELEETDPAQARRTYRHLLTVAPEHADAHINLGRLLHEAGEYKDAEDHYRCALVIRPNDPTGVFNLGVALEDQGQVSPAIEAYERAVVLNESNADAHYNAARLYEKTGEYTAAVRHLRAYRRLIQDR
ncbi:MAG TPA: tetratricopeptide repeat protein [Polyangia bacterium]|nr:tetratricopeptide repeat protein [Polyangia bacterium]